MFSSYNAASEDELLLTLGLALASAPTEEIDEEVVVTPDATASSAQARALDATDIAATPGRSADDLLRATRGLHQSSHGGQGKAFQYFLRGFDAVHGADLAVSLEGVPLNEVSNVHGHGYLDLHMIPRRLLLGARLEPGVQGAEVGDFGVAGGGSLSLGLADSGLQLAVGAGTDRSASGAVAFRPEGRGAGTFGLLEHDTGRGNGPSREYTQTRAALGIDGQAGDTALRAFVLAYRGDFESPGVVREVDVQDGAIGFLGSYPNSGSGRSERVLLGAVARTDAGPRTGALTAWAGWRGLELRQNYTGSYVHPARGDAILQTHEALSGGLVASGGWRVSTALALSAGADARVDRIDQTEAGIDRQGDVWDPRIDTSIDQRSVGAWTQITARPVPWLDVRAGVRAQAFVVALDRRLDAGLGVGKARGTAPVVGPRLRAELFPTGPIRVLAAAGRGFRSPEARGVETGRAPISVSDSGELGLTAGAGRFVARGGAFATWIGNEIVFDHTTARFLTTGGTRRLGGFGGFTAQPIDALTVELDVTGSDGRYTADGEAIPYAPRWLVVGTASTRALVTGAWVWTAGARSWWLGKRPLPGGFVSHAAWVTDLTITTRHRGWQVDLDLDNVLNTRWRDGEFFYPSAWTPGEPASALAQRHVTAGTPFTARLTLGWRL